MWCIPDLDEEYVERMEDILALYTRPLNPEEPVICFDEKSVQCLDEKRKSIRVKNGSVRRDYEYIRRGTANVFCVVEPRSGRRLTKVTPNRKKKAFALMLREVARAYPKAETVHLVMDNLNTHCEKSLIETFGETKGRKLWNRFTIHYTPKHASWLNQAEIEIGLYTRQCLGSRRINSFESLASETQAWRKHMNRKRPIINWKFGVREARKKFSYSKTRGKITLTGH